jgi:hypothetical protein
MTVIVDNTGFSVEHWSRFNEAEFVEQAMKEMFFKQYQDDVRRELLKVAYKIINDPPRAIQAAKRI